MEKRKRRDLVLYALFVPILLCIGLRAALSIIALLVFYMGMGLWGLGAAAVVYIPFVTIIYCKRIRCLGWKKYLFCVYNAVVFLLSYPDYTIMAGIAVYALLCGLLTLIYYHQKDKNHEQKEIPIGSGYMN